jgi:hypothetical protein
MHSTTTVAVVEHPPTVVGGRSMALRPLASSDRTAAGFVFVEFII